MADEKDRQEQHHDDLDDLIEDEIEDTAVTGGDDEENRGFAIPDEGPDADSGERGEEGEDAFGLSVASPQEGEASEEDEPHFGASLSSDNDSEESLEGAEELQWGEGAQAEETAALMPVAQPASTPPQAVKKTEKPGVPVAIVGGSAARQMRLLLILVGIVGIACALVIGAAHVNDRYGVDIASGSWIALAKYADEGVLYPPLYDEETGRYAGTRYMPITILLHTLAAQTTGEYLISGKLVSYACGALMVLMLFITLLARRSGFALACGLTGLVLLSPTGMESIMAIRGDALPLALQLLAVLLMSGRAAPRRMAVVAGLVCAAAVLCKLSAGWATMAIGLWLLVKDRKGLLLFAAGFAGVLLVAGLVLWPATDGRFFANVVGLTFSGSSGLWSIVEWAPRRLVDFTTGWAPACWALLPAALLGCVVVISRREFTLYHLSLACCVVVLLVLFADAGVGENHVVDLLVLSSIVVGDFASRTPRAKKGMATGEGLLASIVIGSAVLSLFHKPPGERHEVIVPGLHTIEAAKLLASGNQDAARDAEPMKSVVGAEDLILADDPYVPISLGQLPVVMDGFMLRRLKEKNPEWVESLVARIQQQEFDKVIVQQELDADAWWYDRLFFGRTVTEALEAAYELDQKVNGYYVYVKQ